MLPLNNIDHRLTAIFRSDVYAIGGRVRDWLINRTFGTNHPCKDFDYVVTGHRFDEVEAALRHAGARIDPVGASFAILKVTMDGMTIDVALPRRESSTGNGHCDFSVDFGPEVSLGDDQLRRDFTINALSVRLADGRLITSPGAVDDIFGKRIRALSPSSFSDDPLRMMRAAQFASRLGFTIESSTRAAIMANAALLGSVSPERINEELVKILMKSPKPSSGFRLLLDLGLLPWVLPELIESVETTQNVHHAFTVFGHLMATLDAAVEHQGDLSDRLAALLHDVGKPRTARPREDLAGNSFHGHEEVGATMSAIILRRLRFSDEIVTTVERLVANHMFATVGSDGRPFSDAAVRRLLRRIGPDRLDRQFALRYADMRGSGMPRNLRREKVDALFTRMQTMASSGTAVDVRALAISGRDVIDHLVMTGAAPAGFRGDRRVGTLLNSLLELVLDDPSLNTRDALLARLYDDG